jgi:hypothetical protein
MSARVREGKHGMSYDFGVSIAKGTIQALSATVVAVTALTASVYSLLEADDELVTMINKNQISFGGYANTLKAIAYAEKRAAEGIGFNTKDLVSGFRHLQQAGFNARKETNLVAKAALGMNSSFEQTASTIKNGDFNALYEAGVITQRTAMSFNAMGFSAQQASKQVMGLIREANKKGLFDGAVQSMGQITSRFKQFRNDFVFAIIGDPRDPEGLAYNVKKYMTKIADFLNTHRNTIIYYGKVIGRVFRFVINVVGDFLKVMWKNLFGIDKIRQKSMKTMQDQLLSFGLWIEILRVKIKMFFEDYGAAIAFAIKALIAFKAVKIGINMWKSLQLALNFVLGLLEGTVIQSKLLYRYFRYLWNTSILKGYIREFGGLRQGLAAYARETLQVWKINAKAWGSSALSGVKSFGTGIASAATSAWSFTAAMAANPITWVVAAVVALVAAVVWLVKNWDELWYKTQSMEDTWYNMLNPLYMIIKYWEEIKAVAGNIWYSVKAQFSSMWSTVQTGFYKLKYNFMQIKNWVKEYIYKPFQSTWDAIGNFFKKYVIDPIQSFFNKFGSIIDKFFGGSKNTQAGANLAVNSTKTAAKVNQTVAQRDIMEVYKARVAANGGKATKDDIAWLSSKMASGMSDTKALMSSDDVKANKEKKYADMTTAKLTTTSDKVDFTGTQMPREMSMGGGSSVNIHAGAVQINLGSNSGMDENKIATLVERKLKELMLKNRLREQGN